MKTTSSFLSLWFLLLSLAAIFALCTPVFTWRTILKTKQLDFSKRISAIGSVYIIVVVVAAIVVFCAFATKTLWKFLFSFVLFFFLFFNIFRSFEFYDAVFCIIFKLYTHSLNLHLIHRFLYICFYFNSFFLLLFFVYF